MTSTTPRSLRAHYLFFWILNWAGSRRQRKWQSEFRGTSQMTGNTTWRTPLLRPSPCLQPTPAIYREAGTPNVTHTAIAVHDISDMHCLGSCALTTDKKNSNYAVNCVFSSFLLFLQVCILERSAISKPSLSPALWDLYQKESLELSLYPFWVVGEGVSISWQSLSGEEGD